jgi:hypothetical protein
MPVTLTIRDETASGRVYHEVPLEFPCEKVTVRELIRERVCQEVQDFNRRQDEQIFRGLVQPNDTERVLNGAAAEYHFKQHRQIEWKPQFATAIDAFGRGGFLVLIDEKQAASLDQEFTIGPETEVSFVKLTLLVGG